MDVPRTWCGELQFCSNMVDYQFFTTMGPRPVPSAPHPLLGSNLVTNIVQNGYPACSPICKSVSWVSILQMYLESTLTTSNRTLYGVSCKPRSWNLWSTELKLYLLALQLYSCMWAHNRSSKSLYAPFPCQPPRAKGTFISRCVSPKWWGVPGAGPQNGSHGKRARCLKFLHVCTSNGHRN